MIFLRMWSYHRVLTILIFFWTIDTRFNPLSLILFFIFFLMLLNASFDILDELLKQCTQSVFVQIFHILIADSIIFYNRWFKKLTIALTSDCCLLPSTLGRPHYKLSSYTSVFSAKVFIIYNMIFVALDLHVYHYYCY